MPLAATITASATQIIPVVAATFLISLASLGALQPIWEEPA